MGGFHSPVEKESLRILLRGSQPVIICPAQSLTRLRIPKQLKKPLDEGRLLFLSPFPDNRRRSDIQMSLYRNRFVAALADWILIPYAGPSSKTEQFCREILAWRKPVYTFRSAPNENLITLGARPLTPGEEVEITLRSLERS
jgi:predicted Rossmann fold nucleotide-binding protein DprA/Smf involved in DNA uptake